ncbi:hypothetical protein RHMOL_Rhmol04G0187200 [Rhododendron molle]|uniref:Uncharacterized protein n=1 Tax=Rhododendron molle TaxID=49168 RepID=A0ACC0P291_RHOML|nr:hypothetical protein RHMOL_Rhmol04G0187200 [Rhododendron molle]
MFCHLRRLQGKAYQCLQQKLINVYLKKEYQNCVHIEATISKVKNSPQQSAESLDCGGVVCYIIQQYVKNDQIAESLSKEECDNMRATMLNAFLTDPGRMWDTSPQNGEEEWDPKTCFIDLLLWLDIVCSLTCWFFVFMLSLQMMQ